MNQKVVELPDQVLFVVKEDGGCERPFSGQKLECSIFSTPVLPSIQRRNLSNDLFLPAATCQTTSGCVLKTFSSSTSSCVQKYEILSIPSRQEWMYLRLFLRIFKFGRKGEISRAGHGRHFNLSCRVEAFFEVVCNGCQCRVPQTFPPLLLPCTVHEPRWCFTKGCKIFVLPTRTFLRLMKAQISNWRKTQPRWPKPVGFTETPVYLGVFLRKDVSFSPLWDS